MLANSEPCCWGGLRLLHRGGRRKRNDERCNQKRLGLPRAGDAEHDRRSLRGARNVLTPIFPAPLNEAKRIEELSLERFPTCEALEAWLNDQGVNTKEWGKGKAKAVSKFYAELKGAEAGVELWRKHDGTVMPVRVTHVLRAKVCSASSYRKNIFLFNTWQQFADGKTRTRNGLLSEKLSVDEMPLVDNLFKVCRRAVLEEEMQRTTEAALRITKECPAPTYDPDYVCPLDVEAAYFNEHSIEVEVSKSYPGLLTVYHLYTVDIVCSGLPNTSFNTLEFDHEDEHGRRKLKYVHAWVWLHWAQIQRYLYAGSQLKERKQLGSFPNAKSLDSWLGSFDVDFDSWGVSPAKSVQDLFQELESSKTQLEVWNRKDGVSLLVRVAHVLNLKVVSTDPRLAGKVLFVRWQQFKNGSFKTLNRLLSNQLDAKDYDPDEASLAEEVQKAIKSRLSLLVDMHFELNSSTVLSEKDFTRQDIRIEQLKFLDKRVDFEDSRSYPSISTVYYLYTVEAVVDGLPATDFNTVDINGPRVLGLHWGTWQETMDFLHSKMNAFIKVRNSQATQLAAANSVVSELKALRLEQEKGCWPWLRRRKYGKTQSVDELVDALENTLELMASANQKMSADDEDYSLASILPPDIVSIASERVTSQGNLSHDMTMNLQANRARAD